MLELLFDTQCETVFFLNILKSAKKILGNMVSMKIDSHNMIISGLKGSHFLRIDIPLATIGALTIFENELLLAVNISELLKFLRNISAIDYIKIVFTEEEIFVLKACDNDETLTIPAGRGTSYILKDYPNTMAHKVFLTNEDVNIIKNIMGNKVHYLIYHHMGIILKDGKFEFIFEYSPQQKNCYYKEFDSRHLKNCFSFISSHAKIKRIDEMFLEGEGDKFRITIQYENGYKIIYQI